MIIRFFDSDGARTMDTNQLQAFDQVVRQGSFSKAARMLDIAQPTITVRIQTLEQAVGGPLFVRGGSRLTLTELGASFLPYARQALAILMTGVETAQLTQRGERGRVIIGTLPTLASGFFASALARMRTVYPDISIFVHTGHNEQIGEMLRDGIVKLGLMTWPFFGPDLTRILQFREPLIVVTHHSHPFARKETIVLEELERSGNPFFHIDWNMEVWHWQSRLISERRAEFELPPQTTHDLLLRGMGAALMTRTTVADDLAAGRLVEIAVHDLPLLYRESVLVRLSREDKLPTVVNNFIALLREEARTFLVP